VRADLDASIRRRDDRNARAKVVDFRVCSTAVGRSASDTASSARRRSTPRRTRRWRSASRSFRNALEELELALGEARGPAEPSP